MPVRVMRLLRQRSFDRTAKYDKPALLRQKIFFLLNIKSRFLTLFAPVQVGDSTIQVLSNGFKEINFKSSQTLHKFSLEIFNKMLQSKDYV